MVVSGKTGMNAGGGGRPMIGVYSGVVEMSGLDSFIHPLISSFVICLVGG